MNRKNSYSPFPNKTTNKQFIRHRHCSKVFSIKIQETIGSAFTHETILPSPQLYLASTINLPRSTIRIIVECLSNPVSSLLRAKKKKKLSPLLPAILTLRYFNSREIAKMAGESSGNRNYSN